MVGDDPIHRVHHQRLEPVQVLDQELRVVLHRVLAAELRVLVLEGVELVGAEDHQARERVPGEGLDVGLGELLEEPRLAREPDGVSVFLLLHAQDGEVHAEGVEDARQGPGRVHAPRVIRGVGAHIPEHVHRALHLGHDRHGHPRLLDPVHALPGVLSHGVAVAVGGLEDLLQLGGNVLARVDGRLARRRHDLDHVHLFRADAEAVGAGGAEPEIRRVQEGGPADDVAVDLPRTVVADDVHRADAHALGALVAPAERLPARQRRDLVERPGVVVGDHARPEHPVPLPREVDALDDGMLLLGDLRALPSVRHPRPPCGARRGAAGTAQAAAGSPG